ncbi:TetR family transcriptional regulator C-terminal domain-containing protein [Microbispora sp. H10830]|uniref:TetR family transcriptional regulator C-terminal domain-containing protein n=1 Tax=Microbispora sp. H10830 TaxID=2729109 RepID=UPI0016019F54|nr:hypothetical protein [Microbispora sp. H10830]
MVGEVRTVVAAARGARCFDELRRRPEPEAADSRGLPAIAAFFERLVAARRSGFHARWGCLVANTHATSNGGLPEIREILERHHDALRAAMRAALEAARTKGQLRAGLDLGAAAEALTPQACAVTLRSRAGAEAGVLLAGVRAVLDGFPTSRTLLGRHGGRWRQVGHRPVQVANNTSSMCRIL